MTRRLLVLVLSFLGLVACEGDPSGGGVGDLTPIAGAPFAAPTGLAVSDELVAVANSEFDGATMSYGPGSVTFVRRSDLAPVARVPTSAKNPAAVAFVGRRALVLCAGETSYDASTGIVSPKSAGALDAFDLDDLASATGPSISIPVALDPAHPLVGYPTSLAVSADGQTAWAGSGTSAAIFEFDLANWTLKRGATDPIALGDLAVQDGTTVKVAGPGRLVAGSFNRDKVFVLDPTAPGEAVEVDVGRSAADMEGVVDVAVRAGEKPDVFALLAISSTIASVDTSTKTVNPAFASAGVYPNRLALAGSRLLIVNSGDNNLGAVDLATGQGSTAAVLPANTNPWDAAVDGTTVYVTGNVSNSLFEVDLATGAVAREAR